MYLEGGILVLCLTILTITVNPPIVSWSRILSGMVLLSLVAFVMLARCGAALLQQQQQQQLRTLRA
jgi:hypothetical protein